MYSFKYNQQDATLCNTLYYWQYSTCFGCFSAHHQELKNCRYSIGYVPGLLAATASVGEFQLTHASGSSKQAWHIPDAACTVFELLMMGGKTARNMSSIDSNKEYCITLHLVGYTPPPKKKGPVNVGFP